MKTFVMLSYDTVFKPRLLYQLLLRRGDDICGVAEVKKVKRRKRAGQPKPRSESGSPLPTRPNLVRLSWLRVYSRRVDWQSARSQTLQAWQ